MTPAELKAWRAAAGLSQVGLAQLLEVNVITVSRWERGQARIPRMLELALASIHR